jgi:hypothetical protein
MQALPTILRYTACTYQVQGEAIRYCSQDTSGTYPYKYTKAVQTRAIYPHLRQRLQLLTGCTCPDRNERFVHQQTCRTGLPEYSTEALQEKEEEEDNVPDLGEKCAVL